MCGIKTPHAIPHMKSLKSHKKEMCRWQGMFLFYCVEL